MASHLQNVLIRIVKCQNMSGHQYKDMHTHVFLSAHILMVELEKYCKKH